MFGGHQKINLIKVEKAIQHSLYLSKKQIIIRSSAIEQKLLNTITCNKIQRYSMSITNKGNISMFKSNSKLLRNGAEASVVKP